ncbi:hypothetical protein GCM10010095_41950 [Streptomyces anthocyanicus]|nr:hypothetical protein GCM10010095_41950 [Streptomyces anthocyanicus]
MDVQDAGQYESAEPGADDRDRGVHAGSFEIEPSGSSPAGHLSKVTAVADEPPTSDRHPPTALLRGADMTPTPQVGRRGLRRDGCGSRRPYRRDGEHRRAAEEWPKE